MLIVLLAAGPTAFNVALNVLPAALNTFWPVRFRSSNRPGPFPGVKEPGVKEPGAEEPGPFPGLKAPH